MTFKIEDLLSFKISVPAPNQKPELSLDALWKNPKRRHSRDSTQQKRNKKETLDRWRTHNGARVHWSRIKQRASKKNNLFDLTLEQFVGLWDISNCECCNVILKRNPGEGENYDNCWWSLDQVIPGNGYTINNVGVLCLRCNRLKNEITISDLSRIYSYLADKRHYDD